MQRFLSLDDLVLRVPQLNQKELAQLANVGALNTLDGLEHRRDAPWQPNMLGAHDHIYVVSGADSLKSQISIGNKPKASKKRRHFGLVILPIVFHGTSVESPAFWSLQSG